MHPILYIHDLDGTPTDAMAQLLRKANPNVTAPDGRFKTLAARTSEAMTALGTYPTTVVVGFGYGALAALALAVANPKRVSVLVLLSPALQWSEPPLFDADTISLPPNLRVVIFHGSEDAVTPISVARTFAERFPEVELVEVDDVADLRGSLTAVTKRVRQLSRPEVVRRRARRVAPKVKAPPKRPERKPRVSNKRKLPVGYKRAPVVFAHDLDRSPLDPPTSLLYRWEPVAPDGFGKSLAGRVADLEAALGRSGNAILGGSGYGAAAAMLVATRFPKRVKGLLLLGPSLDVSEGDLDVRKLVVPATIPTIVVIGTRDLVASMDDVLAFKARCPHVRVETPADSHDLAQSGPVVVGALQDLQVAQRKGA